MKEKDELKEFRESNLDQLQKNMDRLVVIRDVPDDVTCKCPHCGKKVEVNVSSAARDKNRIEASKGIARHLGALQPERITQALASAGAISGTMNKELPPEQQAEMDKFLEEYKGDAEPKLVS